MYGIPPARVAMTGRTRSPGLFEVMEVLGQDYVRTAHAKGLREQVIMYRHVLPNSLVPTVNLLGVSILRELGVLLTAALIGAIVLARRD